MKLKLKEISIKLASNQFIFLGISFALCLIISIQSLSLGVNDFWGGNHTHYNNFLIFKNSYNHLIQNKNLYEYYSSEYADLYKYSPTFAFFMFPLYLLPDSIGLIIWNLLNFFVLYYSIYTLKTIEHHKKFFLIFYLIFELILTTQNSQSNAIIAGLTIMVFNLLEKGKYAKASFFIALGSLIKIYSIIGILLILLYPNKLKSVFYFTVWLILFLFLPLLVTHFHNLVWQYENWFTLLKLDQNESVGMSVFAYTKFLIPSNYYKAITLLFGLIMLLSPLLKFSLYTNQIFKTNYLSLLLIWMVVFNYKAESPTYIIAMSGVGIWFFSTKQQKIDVILILLNLMFTSIWVTDIIPRTLKNNFIDINYIKSFFPILIIIKLYYNLITMNNKWILKIS